MKLKRKQNIKEMQRITREQIQRQKKQIRRQIRRQTEQRNSERIVLGLFFAKWLAEKAQRVKRREEATKKEEDRRINMSLLNLVNEQGIVSIIDEMKKEMEHLEKGYVWCSMCNEVKCKQLLVPIKDANCDDNAGLRLMISQMTEYKYCQHDYNNKIDDKEVKEFMKEQYEYQDSYLYCGCHKNICRDCFDTFNKCEDDGCQYIQCHECTNKCWRHCDDNDW